MAALPSDLHSSAQTSAVPGTTSHDALELGEDSDSTLPELALPELDTSNAPSSPHSIGDGRGTGRVGVPPPLRSAGGSSSSSSSIETLKPEDGALTGTSSSSSSIETLKPPRSAGGASSSSSIETLKPEDTGMSSSSSSSIKTLVPEDTLTRTSSSSSSSSSSSPSSSTIRTSSPASSSSQASTSNPTVSSLCAAVTRTRPPGRTKSGSSRKWTHCFQWLRASAEETSIFSPVSGHSQRTARHQNATASTRTAPSSPSSELARTRTDTVLRPLSFGSHKSKFSTAQAEET
mmetsp:Transcript_2909/g.10433  ORF Transcript_2909/g.10433 Transcript_2909/m.10433 type:complete len:290 (-) Transcript_2909:247-1116(-)